MGMAGETPGTEARPTTIVGRLSAGRGMTWRRFRMAVALALWGAATAVAQTTDIGQTVTGFRMPNYDEQNNLKSVLFGDFARVRPDGLIEITNLKIDFYEEGRVNMTVTSPQCLFNRAESTARSDGPVRIQRDNLLITGTGFWWSAREERFEIYAQSRVEIRGGASRATGGSRP